VGAVQARAGPVRVALRAPGRAGGAGAAGDAGGAGAARERGLGHGAADDPARVFWRPDGWVVCWLVGIGFDWGCGAPVLISGWLLTSPARHQHRPKPHQLLNRGLLGFRSGVLLAFGIRRPLQAALAWLAAHAKVDALAPADAELLERVQKLLTELDVSDDVTQAAVYRTHEKFRAMFGALLLRDRGKGVGHGSGGGRRR